MHLLTLFFVIDGSHAKKRILAFNQNVEKLSIVSFYRKNNIKYDNHYNLGKSPQKQYLRRFIKILFSIPRLLRILRYNPDVKVVYAWNFDIALLFRLSNLFSNKKYSFIYEVADIKPILISKSVVGNILRKLEQFILNKTDILCVTSYNYIHNYFDKYYDYCGKVHLLENKVFPQIRNLKINSSPLANYQWRIGFVGLFRCSLSLKLLYQIATHLPDKVIIVLAGKPEEFVKNEFTMLQKLPNAVYFGEYKYPDDLQKVYSGIDIVWSADFSDSSINSKWLLPNRIYEAGLFSVPQLCFSENESISQFISSLKIGWVMKVLDINKLSEFLKNLNRNEFKQIKTNYLSLPSNQFSGDDQIIALLQQINPAHK